MPFELDMAKLRYGTDLIKRGFAKMQQGGVIMDVTTLSRLQSLKKLVLLP